MMCSGCGRSAGVCAAETGRPRGRQRGLAAGRGRPAHPRPGAVRHQLRRAAGAARRVGRSGRGPPAGARADHAGRIAVQPGRCRAGRRARHLRSVQPAAVEVRRLHPRPAPGPVRPAARPGLSARLPGRRDGAAVGGRPAFRRQRRRPALRRGLLRPPPGARGPGHRGPHLPLGRLGAGPAGPGAGHDASIRQALERVTIRKEPLLG